MSRYPVGIDFGTTNSMIAVFKEKGVIEVISSDSGKRYLPSVIYFKNKKEAVTGDNAKSMQLLESQNTIANVKRYMGTDKKFEIHGKKYSAVELAALFFKKLKNLHRDYTGEDEAQAVITVPAYFDHMQREAVRSAAESAGFDVMTLLNEPTAAALYYNNIGKKENELCLVFDLGGGTLDISLIELNKNCLRVIATGGSTEIGGVDFDVAVADYLNDEFHKLHGIDLKTDPIAYQQLMFQAEKAKMELSALNETNIVIPYITITPKGPLHFKKELDKALFNRITEPIINKIKQITEDILTQNGLKPEDISRVLPVGGASRICNVRAFVESMFKSSVSKDLNPEEAVVCGAAVNAGMRAGLLKDRQFFDVTSHNLGLEDDNGNFEIILEKNEPYPVSFTSRFVTTDSSLKAVTVHVLQDMAKSSLNVSDNLGNNPDYFISLAKFDFQVENEEDESLIDIEFNIDGSGIVKVVAKDVNSGRQNDFTLKSEFTSDIIDNVKIY